MNESAALIATLLFVLGLAGVVLAVFAAKTQNRLAPLRERVHEAASNVRTTVQKKNRLIKQLLDIAAAYATHEKSLHERISSDFNSPERIALNPGAALAYVSRLVNTFPELRADRTYLDLAHKLYELEAELEAKHSVHSASVRDFNSVRLSFPHHLFAGLTGFGVAEHLEDTESLSVNAENPGSVSVERPKAGMSSSLLWIGSMSGIIIVMGIIVVLIMVNNSKSGSSAPSVAKGNETTRVGGHTDKPAVKPVEYGYFVVTSRVGPNGQKESTGPTLEPGYNIDFEPTADVSYQWFADGELIRRIPSRKEAGKQPTYVHNDPLGGKRTYWLEPNQGKDEVYFVYVKYQTAKAPEGWYGEALRTLPRRQ